MTETLISLGVRWALQNTANFLRTHAIEPARDTLEAISLIEDPQVALALIRQCAGFCQMYTHCVPPLPKASENSVVSWIFTSCALWNTHFFLLIFPPLTNYNGPNVTGDSAFAHRCFTTRPHTFLLWLLPPTRISGMQPKLKGFLIRHAK